MFRPGKTFGLGAWAALSLLLSGCVYFNTFFNAEKAYHQALRLREKRLDKNPEDTVALAPDEKLKLERAINKCSNVLELYPEKLQYAPRALFLMGESYLLMGEYSKAAGKYEELLRYYPQAAEVPIAEVHRAKGLYFGGQAIKARTVVEEVLARNPVGEIRREALLLAARMEMDGNSKAGALDFYEKLLAEQGLSRETRAEAHWEAAVLAFELGQWERARGHALAEERGTFATRFQFRNERLALLSLYRLGRFTQAIEEAKGLSKRKAYFPFRAELRLLLARGVEGAGDWLGADRLYREVPPLSPKSAPAAEAYYRLGDHALNVLRREDSARALFDSAAAAGEVFEYGRLGAEKSRALSRLAELRKAPPPDSTQPHHQEFMIAELFLFRLANVDSALSRLDRIVESPKPDSAYTVRAAYARAFIQEEFRQDTAKGDSLYRYVLEKFPGTEWAKQSEKNLGLKPTVETGEDKATALFLAAEELRFGGEDLALKVIPAYAEVVKRHPQTRRAAQAQFVIACLHEDLGHRDSASAGNLDSAKAAYGELQSRFKGTVYAGIAGEKLAAAGVSAPTVPASTPSPEREGIAPATASPGFSTEESRHGIPQPVPVADTVAADPVDSGKPHQEELEPSYENVDQY